jgi:hypothetical protein
MRTLVQLSLALVFAAGASVAAQDRTWTDGVWVASIDAHTYTIETTAEIVTAIDPQPRPERAMTTTEGNHVSLAIIGRTVYVRDAAHAEHPLELVSRGPKYSRTYTAAGSGHFIKSITSDGSTITLEDGSRWDIDARALFEVAEWQPLEAIAIRPSTDDPGFGYEMDDIDRDDGVLANHRVK